MDNNSAPRPTSAPINAALRISEKSCLNIPIIIPIIKPPIAPPQIADCPFANIPTNGKNSATTPIIRKILNKGIFNKVYQKKEEESDII